MNSFRESSSKVTILVRFFPLERCVLPYFIGRFSVGFIEGGRGGGKAVEVISGVGSGKWISSRLICGKWIQIYSFFICSFSRWNLCPQYPQAEYSASLSKFMKICGCPGVSPLPPLLPLVVPLQIALFEGVKMIGSLANNSIAA